MSLVKNKNTNYIYRDKAITKLKRVDDSFEYHDNQLTVNNIVVG